MIGSKRRKSKMQPSSITGWRDGRPIIAGTLGKRDRFGDRSIRLVCPRCWRPNSHGWPYDDADQRPRHQASHCGCWNKSPAGYLLVPQRAVESGGAK